MEGGAKIQCPRCKLLIDLDHRQTLSAIAEEYPNTMSRWARAASEELSQLCDQGELTVLELAAHFGRHPNSIIRQIEKLGLRKPKGHWEKPSKKSGNGAPKAAESTENDVPEGYAEKSYTDRREERYYELAAKYVGDGMAPQEAEEAADRMVRYESLAGKWGPEAQKQAKEYEETLATLKSTRSDLQAAKEALRGGS